MGRVDTADSATPTSATPDSPSPLPATPRSRAGTGAGDRTGAEDRRLAAVRRLGLVGSAEDEHFDRLTRMAAQLLSVESAFITVIEEDHQWIQSCSLVEYDRVTSKAEAFCDRAIAGDDRVMVVTDARADDRFRHYSNVTGEPFIRFYAGRVIRDPHGHAVGTICVTDPEPREPRAADLAALDDLGALVEEELERRENLEVLRHVDTSERTKDLILTTLSEGVLLQDADGLIVESNPAAELLLGMSGDDISGRTSDDPAWTAIRLDGSPWASEDRPAAVALRTGEPVENQVMGVQRHDGSTIWVRVNARPTRSTEGELSGVVVAFGDVTEEQRLLADLRRFQYLFQNANDIITVVDQDGRALYSSPSTERVLGYPHGWHHPGGILAMVHPDDLGIAAAELELLMSGTRGPEPFMVRIQAYDGEWRHVECMGANLLDEPVVGGVVITARDATERVRLAEELAHRATHDELTGLPNRRVLESAIERALARTAVDGSNVAVCFIDLDGFKQVNDTLGHGAGDRLLVEAAGCITASIREGDIAARIGGDEFVVLLDPVSSGIDSLAVARRIRDAVVACGSDFSAAVGFGASVGLAVSGPGDTPDELLRRADTALYRAKETRDSSIAVAGGRLDTLPRS